MLPYFNEYGVKDMFIGVRSGDAINVCVEIECTVIKAIRVGTSERDNVHKVRNGIYYK